jgi:hypothetical protein
MPSRLSWTINPQHSLVGSNQQPPGSQPSSWQANLSAILRPVYARGLTPMKASQSASPPGIPSEAVDWGSVADWIAGLSSLGALVAAIVAVIFAGRSYRHQQAQVAQLMQDRRAEQASKVSAWFEIAPTRAEGTEHVWQFALAMLRVSPYTNYACG